MIYVEMHGRLGNQLFQYAASRSLQKKNNQELCLSFNKVIGANTESNFGWEDSLVDFNTIKYKVYKNKTDVFKELSWYKRIICVIYAISYKPFMCEFKKWYEYQKKWCPFLDRKGIRWIANGYYRFVNDNERDYLFNGSFEAPEYFSDIREELIKEITPKYDELELNSDLYRIIRSTNSVCVSLRHFQLSGFQSNLYNVCSKEYYKKAIETMLRIVKEPYFIFFSDDIEWIQDVIDLSGLSYSIETPNNPLWEKLRLMYTCKHFIIPNSTFAWWAQYLGRYDNKVVIGPEKWFNSSFDSPLVQDSWIRIDKSGKVIDSEVGKRCVNKEK